jgi:hypothetical protein
MMLKRQIKSKLEEYGEVESLTDEGAKIIIDLDNVISSMGEHLDILDEANENCEGDPSCVFTEILYDLDKPKIYFDDRYYPDVDNDYFNEMLTDRLNEI